MRFYYSLETRHRSNLLSSRIIFWTPDRCINFFCSLLSLSLSPSPPSALLFHSSPANNFTISVRYYAITSVLHINCSCMRFCTHMATHTQYTRLTFTNDKYLYSSRQRCCSFLVLSVHFDTDKCFFFFVPSRIRQTDWGEKIRSIYPQRIDSGLIIWRREWRHSLNRKNSHTIWHWTVNTVLLLADNKLYFVAEISPFTILFFYLFITWQLLRFGRSISSLNMWFFNF